MDDNRVLALGLGVTAPWRLVGQRLETERRPQELHLRVEAERGALFACPACGRSCRAHDFQDFTWRHLNFFQHQCIITAKVPRTSCPDHGVKRVQVPWARPGSRFTLLFEQAALLLAREMPVLAAAGLIGITDKRLWRIVEHYVALAVAGLDLTAVQAVAFDETAAKRGHVYVTVFIDLDRKRQPVLFVTPGKGKETVARFRAFLSAHGGAPGRVVEVVCDMSQAFLAAVGEQFPTAAVTVDWFHVVQLFTKAVDAVRKAEAKLVKLPSAARWAVLKAGDGPLTERQAAALAELETGGFLTATAWRLKEQLRWVRQAESPRAARWRLTHFLRHARDKITSSPLFKAVSTALDTVHGHFERILRRWTSTHTNARLEALNGTFQLVRARARGYRNIDTFIAMIYLVAAPLPKLVNSI